MDKKVRVLMVDDEEKFRTTTEKLLNRRGFDVVLAESGEEAIRKLDKELDVVILDIRMGGMDGHQALKEIKRFEPNLPVIMLTGHGDMPSARKALDEGAFDYLSKPCDINILASKINDAVIYQSRGGISPGEKKVENIMIPIEDYTTLERNQTVKDAILKLKKSFMLEVSTSRIMETGHRSILVFDKKGRVQGALTIRDLLEAILPAYINAPKPSTADSIQYSPMFWQGMFTKEVRALVNKRVDEIMSPPPLTIDGDSNLMEASYLMVKNNQRRLVVTKDDKVIGMIREQDLFFEIERVQRGVF